MRPRFADLFTALRDPDPRRADKAYDSILFERGAALPDLVELYNQTEDAVLRFYAVQLMGFSEDAKAIPPVVIALDDPEANVRAEACRALEDLKAKTSIEMLRRRTTDFDAGVRRAARETLLALGDPEFRI